MNERLLQFIWQFQYFNRSGLISGTGESIEIIHPGNHNTHQGPDFLDARIKIGGTIWVGTVELHIRTSEWERHGHQHDPNYNNVIVHVVWEHDRSLNGIPVLELKDHVPKILLERFDELMRDPRFVPCEKVINPVDQLTWSSWKDRLMAERLERRAVEIARFQEQNNGHWEDSFWWILSRNFGVPVNTDAFEAIARTLPFKLISKLQGQIHQVESLLLGQAGLLKHKRKEDYPQLLQKEYQYLKKKFRLEPIHLPVHFLRMRPASFPTVRLAQLAALLSQSFNLFDKIRDTGSISDVRKWFDVCANDYWHYHYRFDEESPFLEKRLGGDMINNLLINTVSPVLFSIGHLEGLPVLKSRALRWLEEIPGESNSIARGFSSLGIESRTAFDSQAMIELKKNYCDKKRCLECTIGYSILRK